MKKFRTALDAIKVVEVVRETEQSVYLAGNGRASPRRQAKHSTYDCYHDTWEAAHAHLLKRAEQALTGARNALQRAQDKYGNVKGMKPPKE